MNVKRMKDRMKICIIGCGSWAAYYSKILGNFFKKIDLYFYSRDIQKAKLYCDMFKGKGYFYDINKAIQDQNISAFMIFTPHNVHLQNIQAFANSSQYILLQKPIAASLEDAKEIVSLCNERNLNLMIAENFRFMPAVKTTKKILDSNILGKPSSVYIQETNSYIPQGWRIKLNQMGGGILIDLGIHYLSMLRYLFGEPFEVCASLPKPQSPEFQSLEMEGESAISVDTKMNRGVSANINLAWGLYSNTKTRQIINIICEKGSLDIKIHSRFLNLRRGKKEKMIFLGFGDISGHKNLIEDFLYRAEKKLPIIVNHKIGIDDLAFVKIAYKSLEEKKVINAKEFYLQNGLAGPE